MAQKYKSDGSRIRPYETVKPLADDLGLTVNVSCDRDDQDCVNSVVEKFSKSSNKDVLICWEHEVGPSHPDAPRGSIETRTPLT